jgi:hypothetical protein
MSTILRALTVFLFTLYSVFPWAVMSQELNLTTPTQAERAQWSLAARQSFYAYTVDSKRMEARVAGVGADLLTRRVLSDFAEFQLDAGVRLENGSHKALDVSEFAPNQQVLLHEGLLKIEPASFFELKIGGINQKSLNAPQLIDQVVFVGASEQLNAQVNDYEFFLLAQQLIPNNRNLSTRLGSIDEGTPRFLSFTGGAHLGGDLLELELAATWFKFDRLSNSVADQSRYLGNSVRGVAVDSAEFDYQFQGHHLRAALTWFFSDDQSLNFDMQYLFNSKAPNGRNQGQYASLGLDGRRYLFEARYFSLESDAAIAFYNTKLMGHTNRQGGALVAGIKVTDGQIALTGVRAKTLKENIRQDSMDLIALNYVHFFNIK